MNRSCSVLRVALFSLVMAWSGAAYAQSPPPSGGGDECTDSTSTSGGIYTKDTWPCEITKRPITLAKGMAEIRMDVGINLSRDLVGKPFTFTPAVYYGVSDKLSVGVNNDTLCLSGTTGGCAKTFNSLGVDAIFAFIQGDKSVGAHAGLSFSSLDPSTAALNVGILARLTFGKTAVVLDPRLEIGLNNRTAFNNKEGLAFPVNLWFQATPKLAVGIDTGLTVPDLGHAGDFYSVPIGFDALFAVSNKIDVGGRFGLDQVAAKPKPASATDARSLAILVNFRL